MGKQSTQVAVPRVQSKTSGYGELDILDSSISGLEVKKGEKTSLLFLSCIVGFYFLFENAICYRWERLG
jgi:hypothetical protein